MEPLFNEISKSLAESVPRCESLRRLGRRGLTWAISGVGCAIAVCMACPAQAGAIATILGQYDALFGPISGPRDFPGPGFNRTVIGTTSDAFSISSSQMASSLEASVFSAAGNGGVHARANTLFRDQVPQPLGNLANAVADGYARLTMDDMIISGAPGTSIVAQLNLHLTGAMEAGSTVYTNSSFTNGSPQAGGAASIDVSIDVAGNNVGAGFQELESSNGAPRTVVGSGLLAHFSGNDVLTTSPFTVAANIPFSVTLYVEVLAVSSLSDGGAGLSTATADFSNTLTFVQGGPVFDLPDGYTANSLEAGIVNNRFGPADGPSAVPEPSSIILWGIGVLCLSAASVCRRKRARVM